MGMQTFHWEHPLLVLAQEALESPVAEEYTRQASSSLLDAAYRQCEEITRQHSRTFFLASSLLPPDKRRAIRALYAFCRVTDDLVDRASQGPASGLRDWRNHSLYTVSENSDPVALAWKDARQNYCIPIRYAEQLINGVAQDLKQSRYATFSDLATYCYGVACTVGLMSMHIIGYAGSEAVPYAIRLGVALQMTNILRDIGEDWRAGRIYLPQDELEAFDLTEEDIAGSVIDSRWRAFMRFQIERNRQLYQEALPGIALLDRDGRFAIGAAAGLYQAILEDIEAHDYQVFNRRSNVGSWGKLHRLPGIWLSTSALKLQR
jgi:phytoene synthase